MAVLSYDVLVIGGGHAGAEAAWAAARLGARTALVTFQRDAIGRMSCNPAVGGIGKGQIVREIDALGGLMGRVIDEAGIQFRMLNRRKGPAVWAPRAQADMADYAAIVRRYLESTPNLTILEAGVERIVTGWRAGRPPHPAGRPPHPAGRPPHPAGRSPDLAGRSPDPAGNSAQLTVERTCVSGVILSDGRLVEARTVIVTSGTFLRGLMHTGEQQTAGGRVGEAAAVGLSASLAALGLTLGRLKTGTPPRLARDSIDFGQFETQPGDANPAPFSFLTERITQPQVECWLGYTNPAVHALIRENLHRAPMYSGQIQSRGPRYCPSIEDKVVRFAEKERHQLFLEPEGRESERIYINGISTSLPRDVQARIVALIPGLERARVLQWGYAVEYDFVPPEQIDATLMTKAVAGLFLAGQINGTSGYEEAAGQGLLAGINAARFVRGGEGVVLGRDQAYIGVMIDDLVTRGVTEPYRMFTSRAEHRLYLRYDNADARLTPLGREIGLVDDGRWQRFGQKSAKLAQVRGSLRRLRCDGRPICEWLRRPEEDGERFRTAYPELSAAAVSDDAWGSALVEIKYDGYIERQERLIAEFRAMEARRIPDGFNYSVVKHLRHEARERWETVRPGNLGQATRISGIHPTDVALLMLHLDGCRRQA